MTLEVEFTQALEGAVEAAKARKYFPSYFIQMLAKYGGVEMAKRLLAKPGPQEGMFTLYSIGLLHESMEAVIWDNPRFHALFTKEEIEEAHRRLEELKYFDKR
jgi:hypothetical protein